MSSSNESKLIERWPLSNFTTQRQIDEWSTDDDNVSLYTADKGSRLEFLNFKFNHLSWNRAKYYFKKLGVPIRGKVLEQGAGSFWLSSYLSSFDEVEEVVGVELSESAMLAFKDLSLTLFEGSKPEKIRYVIGDMHRIEVPDNTFDLVVCAATLHHADNLVTMLRESWRTLKPGGWFVALREPMIPRLRADPLFNSHYPEDGTAMYYYREGWRSAFLNAWYTNIRMTPFIEYGFVRGKKMPWLVRRLFRAVDLRRHVYPKVCIAGQKPL